MSATTDQTGGERDSADLAQFGYQQELKRGLGTFSSFAVAFSYISPSTGIFTLFALGLTTIGGVFIWTWPIVAAGPVHHRAELRRGLQPLPDRRARSSSGPSTWPGGRTPGSPAGSTCSPGILTVTAVVATLPLALIPALNGLGWKSLGACPTCCTPSWSWR